MRKNMKYNLAGFGAVILLTLLDQWSKALAVLHLKGQEPLVLWEGVFELNYLENRGAAFGIFQGQKAAFLVCTVLILGLVALYYFRLPEGRRFFPIRFVGILLASGAVGNMIDRIENSYVVDFFYFKLIDFPVFNVADCYVTVGAALLAVLILFYYKEDELEFFTMRRKGKAAEDGKKEEL